MQTPDLRFTPSKHRIEGLTDAVYAIALTLLVIELRVVELAPHTTNAALMHELFEWRWKLATVVVSFYVMATFWVVSSRLHKLAANLDWRLTWLEICHLSLVAMLPFSSALFGEHTTVVTAALIYGAHLLLIATVFLLRNWHFTSTTALHATPLSPKVVSVLRIRSNLLAACCAATFVFAFVMPGYNILLMLPSVIIPTLARLPQSEA
jgi:uncharacterized membrane protein